MARKSLKVAVVGATGAVGNLMVKVLEERSFPVGELTLLASARSLGKTLPFKGTELPVHELREDSFAGIQVALFSAGGSISKKFAPIAAAAGCVVIDNSSAFRMDPTVPSDRPRSESRGRGSSPQYHRQSQLFHHPDGGGAQAHL